MKRPNIVVIITHDTGRYLGCYGASVDTPNLDRLAASGARFDQAFCTAAQCSPSRGSLLTGRYPHNNGLMGLTHIGWEFDADEVCLPEYVTRLGYDTYLAGVQHETTDPARQGYEHVLTDRRKAEDIRKAATDFFLERPVDGTKPFFFMIGLSETHRPFDRTEYTPDRPEEVVIPDFLRDSSGVRQDLAQFHGSVKSADDTVGHIVDALDASGHRDDTLVVYTTDHGIAFPRAKGMSYDAGIGISLIMRWPGRMKPGRVHDELISNVDLFSTLLEVAGGDIPDNVDGQSFFKLLIGDETYKPRDDVFFEMTWHDRYNPMRGIRTTRYKYIRNFDPESPLVYLPSDIYRSLSGRDVRDEYDATKRPREELYDLEADPLEKHNVAEHPEYAELKSDLAAKVTSWMQNSKDPLLVGPVLPTRAQATRLRKMVEEGNSTGPLRTSEKEGISAVLDGS